MTCMWMSCLLLSGEAVSGIHDVYAIETRASKEPPANSAPTTITSRTMTVNNQENTAIFDGAVVLTR